MRNILEYVPFIKMKMNTSNLGLIIIILSVLAFPFISFSQDEHTRNSSSESQYPVAQLREDLAILRRVLEEGHAGLYRYVSKMEMDSMFDSIELDITNPMSEVDFFLELNPLITRIKCGHTRIAISEDTELFLNSLPIMIPFSFRFINSKAYLLYNYSDIENFDAVGEIISINGNSIYEILQKMLLLISSDADIQSYKYNYLQKSNNFSRLYAILFGINSKFSIVRKLIFNNKEQIINVDGISKSVMLERALRRYPELSREILPISIDYKDDIPVLTIHTFNSKNYTQADISYQEFLKKAFKEFHKRNVKNLIIDLRDNSGGDDEYGKILAAYLIKEPFYYYKSLEYNHNTYEFFTYTNIKPEYWDSLVSNVEMNSNGMYDFINHPNVGLQKSLESNFRGNVFILINGGSFSTAGEATSIIHYNKRAKFVGEECGAAYYGNNSGVIPWLTLPNTKIKVSIPLIKYIMAVEGYSTNRGIIPDYPVYPNIIDLNRGKDTELEYVIELIHKKIMN